MTRMLLVCLLPLLCAASCDTRPSKAVDAHCDDACFQKCDALTAWDGTRDNSARLTALMDAHDAEHAVCDGRRALCVACIQTARKAGAIQ